MPGYVTGALIVLALAGALISMYLHATLDSYLIERQRVGYRLAWTNNWRTYKQQNPQVHISAFIREHRQDWPVDLPYVPQRSYEKLMMFIMATFLVLELTLVIHGFAHSNRTARRPEFVLLCSYTVFAVICVCMCWWLILEERILPSYARTEPYYRSNVPSLPIS